MWLYCVCIGYITFSHKSIETIYRQNPCICYRCKPSVRHHLFCDCICLFCMIANDWNESMESLISLGKQWILGKIYSDKKERRGEEDMGYLSKYQYVVAGMYPVASRRKKSAHANVQLVIWSHHLPNITSDLCTFSTHTFIKDLCYFPKQLLNCTYVFTEIGAPATSSEAKVCDNIGLFHVQRANLGMLTLVCWVPHDLT